MKNSRGPRQKEFCSQGHEFTPENTIQQYTKDGAKDGRKCVKCTRAYALTHQRERRRQHPEKVRSSRANSHMWCRYGIRDSEERDAILKAQSNACAICGATGHSWGRAGFNNGWHVDHDHNNPEPNHRAILCARCNTTLGYVEKVGLQKFTDYLKKHSQS